MVLPFRKNDMIVRNKKAIEREKKLIDQLLVKTGHTKSKKNLDMIFQIYLLEKLYQQQIKLAMV